MITLSGIQTKLASQLSHWCITWSIIDTASTRRKYGDVCDTPRRWPYCGVPEEFHCFPGMRLTNMPENKQLLECLSHWDDSCIKWTPFVAFCKWKVKSLYWILQSGQHHILLLWKERSFRALLQVMKLSSHPGCWSESMASVWFCFECFWIMFWLLATLQQELKYLDSPGISMSSSPWFIQDTNQSAWLEFVLLLMVFSLMVMLWQELIHLESLSSSSGFMVVPICPFCQQRKGETLQQKISTFLVICLCTVAFDFNCLNEGFSDFTCMLCIKKVHRHGFCFSLQKFNLELKGWSRNQVGGVQPRAPFDTRYTHDSFPVWI